MATIKQRVHKFNGSDYDIIHYETEASVVLYTKNSQTNVEGALDTLFTDVAGKAASSHNHAASNITSGTLGVARGGTGANTFTSGAALIGAGTGAVTTKAIDSTSGGTANSASLITSGAVNAGLATKSNTGHTHTSSNITDFTTAVQGVTINASKITGVLSLDNIPASAQERVVTVANQAARYALTTATVQLGDVVKQSDTGLLYFVTDTSKLNQAAGYTEFTAGAASSVPWSGITSKPSSFTPSSHTHGNITNDGKVGTTSGYAVYTTTGGAVTAGTLATTDPTASGTSKTFIDTISQDAKGKITATKKTVATMTAATADAAGTAGLVPAPAKGKQTSFLRGDGTWVIPTNTTYTFATGSSNGTISVTPSGGSATDVAVKGLGSAAYTASTEYAAASHDHAASNITSGTLGIARGGTGATSALAAITALGGWSHLSKGTSIASTAAAPKDLNTYTTPGVYYSASAAESATIVNAPTSSTGFKLHVLQNYSTNYRFQLVISGAETLYYRSSTNSGNTTWSDWKQLRPWTATTASIGSASAGTAIAAADITAWNAGTLPSLTITSIAADAITAWNAGTATKTSVSKGELKIEDGTAPSLSHTAKSIGSASGWSAGTKPSLTYTAKSIPNISVTSKTVVTGIS